MSNYSREAERLDSALQESSVAFSYFDAADRLRLWNAAYERLNFRIGHRIRRGAYFPDLLAELVTAGQIDIGRGGVEAWLAARLVARRHGQSAVRKLADGRVFLVQERRDEQGGTLGFWVDITNLTGKDVLDPFESSTARPRALLSDPFAQDLFRSKLQTVLMTLEAVRGDGLDDEMGCHVDDAISAVDCLRGILDIERRPGA